MIKCWYYRRSILSSVDENVPLSAEAQRHVQGCAACRKRYEFETQIARQLAAGAAAEQQSPSPFLHSRIVASVANARLDAAERRPQAGRLGRAAALGAACVLVAGLFWLKHAYSPGGPVQPSSGSGRPVAAGISIPIVMPEELQLREWTAKLDDPLENEMQLVYRDSTNAVNSLAKNFLPDQFRSSLFELGSN